MPRALGVSAPDLASKPHVSMLPLGHTAWRSPHRTLLLYRAQCFQKSRLCAFREIDYFISHSWSDDAEDKWLAMQRLRTTFVLKNGREPIICAQLLVQLTYSMPCLRPVSPLRSILLVDPSIEKASHATLVRRV